MHNDLSNHTTPLNPFAYCTSWHLPLTVIVEMCIYTQYDKKTSSE